MKIQNQILCGSVLIALAILFQPQLQNQFFATAHARVAGMDARELVHDIDFRKAVTYLAKSVAEDAAEDAVEDIIEDAVEDVIEGCRVNGKFIYC